MKRVHKGTSAAVAVPPDGQCNCIQHANELYDFFEKTPGGLPIFWSLIDFDRNKLGNIFCFFREMRLLMEGKEDPEVAVVMKCLGERLTARFTGKVAPIPITLEKKVGDLSKIQIEAFETLDRKVSLCSAFELFVTGSLVSNHQFGISSERESKWSIKERDTRGHYEPDGAGFFFWTEFALLAAHFGFAVETWKHILPVLLRSSKIFALCYGKPSFGSIPSYRKFGDYEVQYFQRIHPLVASRFGLPLANRFDDLELEATACARFAFPGEFHCSKT